MSKDPGTRIHYLDALRVISICAVIVLHVSGSYWYQLDVTSYEWNVTNAYNCLVRWGVPVFVMISGALFLDPKIDQPIRKLWTWNIPHLMALILFWGAVYALLFDLPTEFTPETIASLIHAIVFGPQHLWFLFMLIGLYVLVPILRCVTQNETATRYFLVVGFVVNVLFPLIKASGALPIVNDYFDLFLIKVPIGYSFYFVLGYYLASHDLKRWTRIVVYVLGIAGLIGAIVATANGSAFKGSADNTFINGSYFFMMASAAVFVFVKRCFRDLEPDSAAIEATCTLAPCTLGVYVTHIIVLRLLMTVGFSGLANDPLIGIPLLAALTAALSFGLAWILKKIPWFGKYLV